MTKGSVVGKEGIKKWGGFGNEDNKRTMHTGTTMVRRRHS